MQKNEQAAIERRTGHREVFEKKMAMQLLFQKEPQVNMKNDRAVLCSALASGNENFKERK